MGLSHSPKLVTDGLVLCLDAANPRSYPGTGTVWKDISGNGNNATLLNGTSYNSADLGSISFDGGNDYADIPNMVIGGKNFTVEQYLNPTKTSSQCFFGKHDSGGGNSLVFGHYGGGYHVRIVGRTTQSIALLNDWQHLVLKVETIGATTQITLYRNNILLYNTNLSTTLPDNWDTTGKPFTIGQDWDGGSTTDHFGGEISVTRMYNRTLTEEEIQQNYQAFRGRYGL